MEQGSHHIVPPKSYLNVLLALLGLTILTVVVAKPVSGLDLGFLNTAVAMLIATVKASIVLAIFMHLKYDNKLHLALFLTGIFFVILLFAFSYIDIISRVTHINPV